MLLIVRVLLTDDRQRYIKIIYFYFFNLFLISVLKLPKNNKKIKLNF
jgi:hypothetical protein